MICLCGLPASGKSTLLAALAARVPGAQCVQFDSFLAQDNYQDARRRFYEEIAVRLQIMAGGGAFESSQSSQGVQETNWACCSHEAPESAENTENAENETSSAAWRLLQETKETAALRRRTQAPASLLLAEHTFQHRSARKLAARLAQACGVQCVFLHLNTPEDVCRARNGLRGRPVQEKSFENVMRQFDAFSDEEIVLTALGNEGCDEILQKALKRLADGYLYFQLETKSQAPPRPQEAENALRRFDLESRKLIGELVKAKEYRPAAYKMNEARREALEHCRAAAKFDCDTAIRELRQRLEGLASGI